MARRFAVRSAFTLAMWALLTATSSAQVTIVSPAPGTRLAAGPDFATDVLGDPWDFSNAEDVGIDPTLSVGWSSLLCCSGTAGGTTATNDPQLSVLFHGYYGIINPGRNGMNFPIDTSRYQKISFKLYSGIGGQNPQVYWYHNSWNHPSGIELGGIFVGGTAAGAYAILVGDLTQPPAQGVAWTAGSVVRGIRLDPISVSGYQAFYDWVRLTAPDGASDAAIVTIQWSGGSGNATIEVIDAGGTTFTVATNVLGTSYPWNYGILPSGNYTLRVTRGGSPPATSSFSINDPPLIAITDPDETGSEDYATTVLANPWDMSDSSDVLFSENVTSASFSGGQFHGTNTNNDPAVTLLGTGAVSSNNAVPIDSQRYRFLTYRFEVDGAYDLGNGSVARILWGSEEFANGATLTTTKDIIVWPGMNSYTIDLASLSVSATGGLEPTGAQQIWTAASVRHLRFDPHEFSATRTFHIDDVKLTAMDEANGSFTIRWTGSDADAGDSPTVSLYYDANTDPADGKTLIASGLALGAGQYSWNSASVVPAEYYIYAEVTDGIDTSGAYSTGKLRVNSPVSSSDPLMNVDAPASGATIVPPFTIAGWAIDRGASGGTGVNEIHVYAQPSGGGAPTFLGAASYGQTRSDVGSAFGAQFTNSGFSLAVSALAAGSYQLLVYAKSTVTGTFNNSSNVPITVPTSDPHMALDTPGHQTAVSQPFTVAGWAIDRASPTGTGVDEVHVWAHPVGGGSAVFLGIATTTSRPDVGAIFGSRFTNSGYHLTASGLVPGASYDVVAYARSSVSGTFNNSRLATVTVNGSDPLMAVDTPASMSTVVQPFAVAGWAIDRAASSGPGVDAVHAWAYPVGGGSAVFVGAASNDGTRADVGAVFGSQFTNSGYHLSASGLTPSQTYDLVIYARSTVTGTFNNSRTVRVTVAGSDPRMSIDAPSSGASVVQPFQVAGWAIDRAAPSGTGVDVLHVWAHPVGGGSAVFLGIPDSGAARADVGNVFGSQFTNSGYNLIASGLSAGVTYDVVVYAHSTVTGTFNISQVVRILVQ